MAGQSRWQGRADPVRWVRPAGTADWAALGLAVCLVVAVLVAPSALVMPASASPLAGGLKARMPTSAVEPAQDSYRGGGRRPGASRDSDARGPRDRPDRGRSRGPRFRIPLGVIPDLLDDDDDDGDDAAPPRRRAQPPRRERPARRPPQPPPAAQRFPRQIVALVDQARPQSVDAEIARTHGLQVVSSRPIGLLGARAVVFRIPGRRSEAAALAAVQGDSRVRSAQYNMRYLHSGDADRKASVPQYGPRRIRLPDAHRLALGRNVAVAVIDSAVDTGHPDLKGAAVRSYDAVGEKDAAPDYHGTAVAGIIASRGVVEGVAPEARLMAVRAFRAHARGPPDTSTALLLTAIDWAAGNGAKVLNMSFVGPRDGVLEEALQAAARQGIVLVAAAGNGGPKAAPAFPAAYPGVIAVTAVDEKDRRYRRANRGKYITVAAPGVDVLAPVDGGKRDHLTGTSFATAYVSGIAALLLERDPTLDAAAVYRLIAEGAHDLGPPGRDEDFGAGLVDALASVTSVREGLAARPAH